MTSVPTIANQLAEAILPTIGSGPIGLGRSQLAHFFALVGHQCIRPAHFWALNQT